MDSKSRKRSNPEKKVSPFEKKEIKILLGFVIVLVVILALIVLWPSAGEDNLDDSSPIAILDTSKGEIQIELYQDDAPETVANFIQLANDGFYDEMIFHRISDDFMIQAGNTYLNGTTKSSPYGNIDKFEGGLSHVDGAISMASTGMGVPGSAQFFICDGPQTFLDGNYAVFGVVISGIDVVRDIADDPHDNSNPAGGGIPNEDIIIYSITIEN